jgi:hypothetical protein
VTEAFSPEERREIVSILGLQRNAELAEQWLAWLSYEVLNSRRISGFWHDMLLDLQRQRRSRRKGRPSGEAVAVRGEVYAAAVAYQRCTGKRPTNARSGRPGGRVSPFFRLAQICTRLSDPGPFIAKLPRPFSGEPLDDFQSLPGEDDELSDTG